MRIVYVYKNVELFFVKIQQVLLSLKERHGKRDGSIRNDAQKHGESNRDRKKIEGRSAVQSKGKASKKCKRSHFGQDSSRESLGL